jgi:DNA mismatch repair protein MutS2
MRREDRPGEGRDLEAERLSDFLEGVEYPRVLEGIADACTTADGRALLRSMRPLDDDAERRRRLDNTRLLEDHVTRFGAPPVPDPTGNARALEVAREKGESYDGRELAALAVFLDGVTALRRHLAGEGRVESPFREWLSRLDALPALRSDLSRSVSDAGEILDAASPGLSGARALLRRARLEADAFFQRLLARGDLSEVLRERTVTERNGRRVVPVRRDAASSLPGIVHGVSASGSTAFVEPREAVALNNALNEATSLEDEETRKVLRELTGQALRCAPALEEDFRTCAEVDAHLALALFAARFGGRYLEPEEGVPLVLREARHPLLCLEAGDAFRERVVPLELELPAAVRVVLLSGPNAGGKTVALKTLGLLCVLAAAGLPVPARPTSRIPRFTGWDTDLGDGQSLADHLSTYEARLRALMRMLGHAGPGTLLLLDELGAGTDPQEGGALGLACLESFRAKGAFVFATTHQPLLKLHAQQEAGMLNAAMLMDEATGRPTFRFAPGFPGRSHAMELAVKVGFPPAVLEQARRLLPEGEADLSDVLAGLEAERRALEKARVEAERFREAARRSEEELREAKRQVRDEARRIRHEAQVEAEGILRNTRRQMEHILQGVGRPDEADREKIRQARGKVEVKLTNLRPVPLPKRASAGLEEVRVGEEVLYRPAGLNARVLEADDARRQAVLQAGSGPRITCRYEDLAPATKRARGPEASPAPRRPQGPDAPEAVPLELDIRGFTVDQGVTAVERHLDHAAMAGMPFVRVLHGKGTGKLKTGVLAALRGHPAVAAFRDAEYNQGGSGVTVVDLKRDDD